MWCVGQSNPQRKEWARDSPKSVEISVLEDILKIPYSGIFSICEEKIAIPFGLNIDNNKMREGKMGLLMNTWVQGGIKYLFFPHSILLACLLLELSYFR